MSILDDYISCEWSLLHDVKTLLVVRRVYRSSNKMANPGGILNIGKAEELRTNSSFHEVIEVA